MDLTLSLMQRLAMFQGHMTIEVFNHIYIKHDTRAFQVQVSFAGNIQFI